jgi:perosamine synthetase
LILKIAYTKPSITQLEIDYAADAASTGWGERCYDYIIRFEKEFSEHVGSKFAIATSSCTGAMTLGLAGSNIGIGDEVILADTNWIATASPIVHVGAKPIFVDILPDTWCIDPIKAESAITARTKAIVATHLYGNLCDMDALSEICLKHGLILIEDAAEAIGSVYKGNRAGSLGLFSTFSFHGTKTLTTGEGGMFVTSDQKLFERVRTLNNHGRAQNQTKQFWADVAGFKFKMSNIQAAIGCAQLMRIDELVERKRSILKTYKNLLSGIDGLLMNQESEGCEIGAWMPNLVFPKGGGMTRDLIKEKFNSVGIDARVFFWPLSSLPMFKANLGNVNAYDLPERSINLPSFHDMTQGQLEFICENVWELCKLNKT